MYIMLICHWAIWHYNMSFQTIAGRSDGVFWWFPALSEDQEKYCPIYQNYIVALIHACVKKPNLALFSPFSRSVYSVGNALLSSSNCHSKIYWCSISFPALVLLQFAVYKKMIMIIIKKKKKEKKSILCFIMFLSTYLSVSFSLFLFIYLQFLQTYLTKNIYISHL